MYRPGSLEEPVVTGAEIVGSGLDGARKMECVERLQP
jgi:hypothetical protein